MHFLHWTKRFHESIYLFWHFQVFWWKFAKFLMSFFQTTGQFFFQFLHDSSVSWKITPLYFFRSNVIYFAIYFAQKGLISANFKDFLVLGSKFTKFLSFWNQKLVFLHILQHPSVSWDINPMYFFSLNFIYFHHKKAYQSTNLVKFHLSSRKSEILHFDGLLCKNHIKFQLKYYIQKSDLSWHWRVMLS